MKILIMFLTAVIATYGMHVSASAEYVPGGAAEIPAIDAFSTWTQFSSPDTQTPAIDETGCLDYALANLAVRYNLPLKNADVFDNSYDYYTRFVNEAIHPAYTKAVYFSDYFAPFVRFVEYAAVPSDSPQESWHAAYRYCTAIQAASKAPYAFVLEMTTASGSHHYVTVESIDNMQERLYLYDSGDRFSVYLGDAVSESRGYFVQGVYTMQITQIPGDADGDFCLTMTDAALLGTHLIQNGSYDLSMDANQDGILDAEDAVYIAKYAHHMQAQSS